MTHLNEAVGPLFAGEFFHAGSAAHFTENIGGGFLRGGSSLISGSKPTFKQSVTMLGTFPQFHVLFTVDLIVALPKHQIT